MGHDTHRLWEKAIEKRRVQREKEEQSRGLAKDNSQGKEPQSENSSENGSQGKNLPSESSSKDGSIKNSQDENSSCRTSQKKEVDAKNPSKNEKGKGEREGKKKEKEEAIKRLSKLGEKKAFQQNKIERKQQLEELRKALARESMGAGTTTNSRTREVTEIGTATPLVDWRRLLREAVRMDIDWSYRNATLEDGVLTPYLEEFPRADTEILLDTSGSINTILLKNFLRECKNILQVSKLKVGCFDTKFYGFHEIRNLADIDRMPFQGGGGTNFDVAVNAFSRRVENKIIFTDGDAYMPDKAMNAIWIVFGGLKIQPKGGRVIYISNEQLKKLSQYYMKKRENLEI